MPFVFVFLDKRQLISLLGGCQFVSKSVSCLRVKKDKQNYFFAFIILVWMIMKMPSLLFIRGLIMSAASTVPVCTISQ